MPTLSIPDATYQQLADKAARENITIDVLAAQLLAARAVDDGLIDTECHAECDADTSPVPTLEEVRAILGKIPGSLAADVIANREER